MPGSFRLGRLAGIEVQIHFSWLIILVLLTGSLATGHFQAMVPGLVFSTYLLAGFVASLLLFASVLAHEFGHALVARARGLPVKSITLFIFGGVSDLGREPATPGTEFQIAIVGPIVSLVLGAITWIAGTTLVGPYVLLGMILIYVGEANVLLAVFNLIPGFPLDGGRVLRSILWKLTGSHARATRWAVRAGQGAGLLFIVWGVWQFFLGDVFGGLWIGFIGWFLLSAALAAGAQAAVESALRGVQVADLMEQVPITVPANITLQHVVDDYVLRLGLHLIPVVQGERFVGILSVEEIRAVARERWSTTPVGHAMTPIERLAMLAPSDLVADILPRLTEQGASQLPVVVQGRLVGMLTRDAILRALAVRRGLGIEHPRRRVRH